jgi:hypothetical protein
MGTIMLEGEAIRKAIKWISGKLQEDPKKSLQQLSSDAVLRFDLSPNEAEFLRKFYHKSETNIK